MCNSFGKSQSDLIIAHRDILKRFEQIRDFLRVASVLLINLLLKLSCAQNSDVNVEVMLLLTRFIFLMTVKRLN